MAVTYPISFAPLVTSFGKQIESSKIGIVRGNAISQSPWTGETQIAQFDFALWEAEIKTVLLNQDDVLNWQSFLISLQGSRGTFLMGDPDRPLPRGKITSAATITVIKAASARDDSIEVTFDNTISTLEPRLRAGDYIQIGTGASSRLYMLTSDVISSGGSFNATLDIQPPLKTDVALSTNIIFINCVGLFRLADDAIYWQSDVNKMSQISFSAVESF